MLVLSLDRFDEIILYHPSTGEIRVQLLERRDGQQRVGFTADQSVDIYRKELWDRIQCGEEMTRRLPHPATQLHPGEVDLGGEG